MSVCVAEKVQKTFCLHLKLRMMMMIMFFEGGNDVESFREHPNLDFQNFLRAPGMRVALSFRSPAFNFNFQTSSCYKSCERVEILEVDGKRGGFIF